MSTTLSALPTPVAADPHFIAQKNQIIVVRCEPFSKTWYVSLHDGTPLLAIEGAYMTTSSRAEVKNPQGQKLYEIRRERFKFMGDTYFAEMQEGGPRLWEMECIASFASYSTDVRFPNNLDGGKTCHVSSDTKTFSTKGPVLMNGQEVAYFEKKRFSMGSEFTATVAQGFDMSIIAGMLACLGDKIKRRKSNSSAGGGSAAAGA